MFCLAAASHTLTQHPPFEQALGPAWQPIWALSVMGAGLFWAFATELFEDRSGLHPVRLAPAMLLLAIGGATRVGDAPVEGLWLAHNLVGAILMVHVLIVIWSGWRNDLVESRRRLRGPVLAAAALYAVIVIAVQTSEILWRPADALAPLAALMLFALGLAGVGTLLRTEPDLFASPGISASRSTAGSKQDLAGENAWIAEKLDRLMAQERAYREEGLSITALALKLRVPEYRLRRLINQELGHRNFNAFLNQWRLGDAKQALADPAEREVPISTIAFDAGYQSLGPFNRAFKAETGLTPSAFRTRALRSASGGSGRGATSAA
ncbi:AraC family transcriptional regulator [Phenylobacterium sp.]|uniref:helix-turn-helix domain-containing protein n=1 Tax=Phenylobacterium sp. TaxID=1871053 RepID=UPI002735079B|nr:AraC family transcriptional regulator [Phenylobacterium sp.]MDP3852529.1 AraC family transcriptional regulator [Phenylobacterium sp.]